MKKTSLTVLLLASSMTLFAACEGSNASPSPQTPDTSKPGNAATGTAPNGSAAGSTTTPGSTATPVPSTAPGAGSAANTGSTGDKGKGTETPKSDSDQVVAKPDSVSVLVNKQFALPSNYEPADLVYPDVPFIFKEKIEKRKMRKEAAAALEKLFAGAKKDGINLAGVSAYRSYATQKAVFNNYVKTDGEEKAKTYSAVPGHSEHETGLAIDVSGSDGKCAAQDCFGATKEAEWLAKHAPEYGFIIRYLKGKESITGYQYEPWHIRYVGVDMAKEIASKGLTLEEYLNAVPVNK
ncbi:D-alanyl-D-alanine carboxypeptidase family protein [Paenibacillus doosanensis]|uniref:D-alanyl-D-alanine carboxypeptidase family protein n=1 Tax=Paenibacillus doosanensis TaxID=1229154 RepID=UPI0021802DF6|nr:D-alanyl-D-alanine carboxypeptidase family protein [Paenibacillus doosanensis]MCS7463762.1 D-alanyl-D-alanine carboxypeptidase family protein [Paenibacillus doosanensis]